MEHLIKVLVVDDSAFFRRTIKKMLESDHEIRVVGTADNGEEAIEKVEELKPDIVTLDIEMPRMNGLEALKIIMKRHRLPVIMVSTLTTEGAEATLDAFDIGAVDFIPKYLDDYKYNINKIREELVKKVKAVTAKGRWLSIPGRPGLNLRKGLSSSPEGHGEGGEADTSDAESGRVDLVAVGTSTGGPGALQKILPSLPEEFPAGILLIQHMPAVFTKPFAARINSLSSVEVKEAVNGDVIRPGLALLAPGGQQMRVKKVGREMRVDVRDEPEDLLYKPSVDVTMKSVARYFAHKCLGIILTGMGNDGLEGMRCIKKKGGGTIAQNRDSCVVYGMPRMVVEAGVADKVVPLDMISDEIIKMI